MHVGAVVMTEMPVMMAAHPGISVQHARFHMHGLDNGGMGGATRSGGHGRCSENGNGEQSRGNRFVHGRLLKGIPELTGRMAGLFDHADDLNSRALNPF